MAGKEAGRALGASNMLVGGLPIAVTGGAEPGAVGGVTVPEIAEIAVVCLSLPLAGSQRSDHEPQKEVPYGHLGHPESYGGSACRFASGVSRFEELPLGDVLLPSCKR